MTQEDKQLLLVDLYGRLPYGVRGRVYAECSNGEYDMNGDMIFFDSPFDVTLDGINISTEELHVVAIGNEDTIDFIEDQQTWGEPYTVDEFKPYLRPMSSMTEEEYEELAEIHVNGTLPECCDFYLKHHLDWRGLIPKGLALEAPKDMYGKAEQE